MLRWKNLLHPEILLGLAVLLLLSLPFFASDLDLSLAKLFYRDGWGVGDQQPWLAL